VFDGQPKREGRPEKEDPVRHRTARHAWQVVAGVALATLSWAGPSQEAHQAAITFDDLGAGRCKALACQVAISSRIVNALKAQGIPAVAFVNEGGLYVKGEVDSRIGILRDWLDARLELGNHTFSHVGIDSVSLPQYEEDVIRGETVTRMLMVEKGRPLRYFRHTQLRTGPTTEYREGLGAFLRNRGYTVAPVTVDTQDYMFAAVYADAKHRGDVALQGRVLDAYRAYLQENFSFHERLAVEVLGREVKHVILLHVNHLNADLIDELVATLKERRYAFIPLEGALQDPAYSRPEPTTRKGWSWIQRWILAEGGEARPEPREPPWVTDAVFKDSRK
jgi:peptidoglycan/xylan/chitin deacetylase (PgdA/CDA1 family)